MDTVELTLLASKQTALKLKMPRLGCSQVTVYLCVQGGEGPETDGEGCFAKATGQNITFMRSVETRLGKIHRCASENRYDLLRCSCIDLQTSHRKKPHINSRCIVSKLSASI